MFLVRLQNFDPLVDATSLFAQIAKDADVKFIPSMFSIIASNRSPRFVATLQMSHRFFTNYSVNQNHSSKICLESFHDAMLEGTTFSAMTIHLLETLNKMTLRFETPEKVASLHHELTLSPAQVEDIGQVEYGKFFILNSKELRRIIKELPLFQDDSVCVTVTNSQIKFSIGLKEIILTKEIYLKNRYGKQLDATSLHLSVKQGSVACSEKRCDRTYLRRSSRSLLTTISHCFTLGCSDAAPKFL